MLLGCFSWAADAHQRPSLRSLCEFFRDISVRNGDLTLINLPAAPGAKQENKAVVKVMRNLRAKEQNRLQKDSRHASDLIQQAVNQAKKGGGKAKSKPTAAKKDRTMPSAPFCPANEPAALELKPLPNYLDLTDEVWVGFVIVLRQTQRMSWFAF